MYLTDKKYDVITLDPSPPIYSAGTVNLYTCEFFKECRRLLNDNGVICLWVPACRKEEFDLILKAFSLNFYTTIWAPFEVPGSFIVGAKEKFVIDKEKFKKRFGELKVRENLEKYKEFKLEVLYEKLILNDQKVKEYVKDTNIMTDDMPYVEFPLLRWKNSDIRIRDKYFSDNKCSINEFLPVQSGKKLVK